MPNDGKMGYAPVGIRIIYPEKRMSLLAIIESSSSWHLTKGNKT